MRTGMRKYLWVGGAFCGVVVALAIVFIVTSGTPQERKNSIENLLRARAGYDALFDRERVLMVGDVLLARDVERTMDAHGSGYPYQHLTELIDTHSYQFANFESSIPERHTPTPDLTYVFSSKTEYVADLVAHGFTHLSLANNHSADAGADGLEHTKQTIREFGAVPIGQGYTTGTSSLAFIEADNRSVAIIVLDLTLAPVSEAEIDKLFMRANAESDIQIVYVHWGTEYENTHNRRQAAYAAQFIAAGADLIVGHHPHVVQDIERINGVPVFYSLGNFIFDQYFSVDVQVGLALSLDVAHRKIDLITITSLGSRNAPRKMPARERAAFLEHFVTQSKRRAFPFK